MKKIIGVESDSIEILYTNLTIDQLLEKLLEIRKCVPGDAKSYAWVDGYDGDELHVNFHYKREETDEEYLERIRKEDCERKRIADDEAEIYRRLKAKFEGQNK